MDREIVKTALEADVNEQIECPVCGDETLAFELATDHAHSKELLQTILRLLDRPDQAVFPDGTDHCTHAEETK